jgi:hypothetical protein
MPVRFQITVDCADPNALAQFWAEALGYDLQDPPDGFGSWKEYWVSVGVPADEVDDGYDAVVDPNGEGPRIWFQQVPEGKAVKNRLHFDVLVGGGRTVPLTERRQRVDEEVARLEALGGTVRLVMDNSNFDHYAVGMNDPEGNEFDVV